MLALFAVALFVSATLLFLVQPMIGKMILPRLGGTPAVWNTCMVFFQAVLLIGYAWTHTLAGWRDRRKQVAAQCAVLLLPFLVLPFSLGRWTPPSEANPVFSVLWLLLGLVGLPFFVVSTTAPLMQKWFAGTDHPSARDPYFLYGASNLGSMLALVLYPVLVEPFFPVENQAWLWTAGYLLFVVLVAGCAVVAWRTADRIPADVLPAESPKIEEVPPKDVPESIAPVRRGRRKLGHVEAAAAQSAVPDIGLAGGRDRDLTWVRRLRWIGLSAAPSSLMLGVTTYLTTDIAAVPFFWVIPLALYLLTFIFVFARWPVEWTGMPHLVVLFLQPVVLLGLVLVILGYLELPIKWLFLLHVGAFFLTALMCHGELARDRPGPTYLTEFYLCMSAGGVLGGLFNGLIAPLVFRFDNVEYPAAMVLACLLRPPLLGGSPLFPGDSTRLRVTLTGRVLDLLLPLVLGGLGILAVMLGEEQERRGLYVGLVVIGVLTLMGRPLRFGLALAALFIGVRGYDLITYPYLYQDRGFFGFVRVRAALENGNVYHVLIHGGIDHGRQKMLPRHRRETITYFHPTGGIGRIFEKFCKWPDQRLPASLVGLGSDPFSSLVGLHSEQPYGVVGLGTGTLAAHAKPMQTVHFYEIDPLVERLSLPEDGREPYFTYLSDALDRGADLHTILGDGRLRMKEAPEKFYHVLVLDAFSSDAIPVHLLTVDAVDLYLSKLADGGILVFNVTNKYVDIVPVLADVAHARGLDCYYYGDYGDDIPDKYGSDWVVMQRKGFSAGKNSWNGPVPLADRLDIWNEPELPADPGELRQWRRPAGLGGPPWSDGYSNLLRVIHW